MSRVTKIHVNGSVRPVDVDGDRSLLDVLREELALTGTKYGCGEGQCGACTVLIDGKSVRSCQTPVESVGQREVTTIEGLEHNGRLHPLQDAFLEFGAMQCGYCTAGMIMSGVSLLRRIPRPSGPEILRFMEGNICRCGTYSRIVAAIERAAAQPKEEQ